MLHVREVENHSLLLGRLTGTLDGTLLRKSVDLVEIKEAQIEKGFNRFCDLTGLAGIRLGLGAIEAIADRRRAFNPNRARVKSAFLVDNPLTFAVVELYRELLKSSRITVQSFRTVESAAKWLGVAPRALRG